MEWIKISECESEFILEKVGFFLLFLKKGRVLSIYKSYEREQRLKYILR